MCFTDCFLIYFTIQAGSACVSTMFLAFGVVGCLAIPLMPYSINDLQFYLVMGYMMLLVAAFTITLCGSLTDSKKTIGLGLILGLMAFLVWLMLTLPSLMGFSKFHNNEFCLGLYCGETHWLVPRNWRDNETLGRPTPPTTTQKETARFLSARVPDAKGSPKNGPGAIQEKMNPLTTDRDVPNVDISSDGIPKARGPKKHAFDTSRIAVPFGMPPWKPWTPDTTSSQTQGTVWEASPLYDDELDWLAKRVLIGEKENEETSTTPRHNVSKRQVVNIATDRNDLHHVEKYLMMRVGDEQIRLTRKWSIILAFLYASLFACVLITIFMNLASFSCREGELEDCEGYCSEDGAGGDNTGIRKLSPSIRLRPSVRSPSVNFVK